MKKLVLMKGQVQGHDPTKKILRVMKLSFSLLLLCLLQLSATGLSQEAKVSFEMENISLCKVFDEIEQQTDYRFVYKSDDLKRLSGVSICAKKDKVSNILDKLLSEKELEYRILDDGLIVVTKISKQGYSVSGKVTDATGNSLPGVNIVEKGTTNGAVTDLDGNYTMTVSSENTVLSFSFVGYLTEEVNVAGQTTINITLIEDIQSLEEVIVVGYGTQRRVNLTGSVATATSERLENRPIQSVAHGLQGVIPNLNVNIRNGDPNRNADFNIRGYESINGGQPLILVDGIPMNMDDLNPSDIESITVLKDAAAAAIYGARAAFGVILVETKSGKRGEKVRVSVSTEQSAAVPIALIDPIEDPLTAAEAWNTTYQRTFGNDRYDETYMEGFKRYKDNPTLENQYEVVEGVLRNYAYVDYKDKTIADYSPQRKYDVNVSGGSDNSSYYVSFGYFNKDGWVANKDKNFKYKRYNILAKTDFQINDWLSLDESVTLNAENNDQPHFYNWDVNINSIARREPHQMLRFPDLEYYLEPGDREQYEPYIGMYIDNVNFLPYLEEGGRDSDIRQDLTLKQGITITPFQGFRIRSDFAYGIFHRQRQDVQSKVEMLDNADLTNLTLTNAFSGNDWIRNRSNYNQDYVFNVYAEYELNQLDNHYVKAMVGFNQEWLENRYTSARNYTLITPLITDLNATTGSQETEGSKSHSALRGVFYRLNYIFKDKYLFETNGRYDGTSRFPEDDRFGFFPSVSVGWRISEEPFLSATSPWLDNLKLRASYGELGNQLLNDYYPYIASMGSGMSPYMFSSAGRIPYVRASGLVSPTLTWETVATQNIGIDITTLSQRLDVSFDYYLRDTKDMLMDVEYPDILGTSAPQSNAADLRTKGWELALNWRDRIGTNWYYGINIALADHQTEITNYDNPTGALSEYYEGQKIGEIWGYETEGIFQSNDEVEQHADQSFVGANWAAGDIKYKDINGDGVINRGENTLDDPGDRKIIGNNTARYSFGINTDLQYKNLALNLFFQGLFRDHLPGNGNWQAFYPFNAGHVESWYIDETWSPDNPDAYFAAPHRATGDKKNIQAQSRYVQNASYMRLKNAMLSYNLPSAFTQRIGIGNAQIYVAGMNLFTLTGMHKPLDPEQVETNTQEYYFSRTFTLGAKVTF